MRQVGCLSIKAAQQQLQHQRCALILAFLLRTSALPSNHCTAAGEQALLQRGRAAGTQANVQRCLLCARMLHGFNVPKHRMMPKHQMQGILSTTRWCNRQAIYVVGHA